MRLWADRVPRVRVEIGGKTSIGTAFPIAAEGLAPSGAQRVLLLTARHVVYPDDQPPGTPTAISLAFPDGEPAVAKEAYRADLRLDGADRPGGADLREDWALLAAELPAAVTPLPWGILEPADVERAISQNDPPGFTALGYPLGNGGDFHGALGKAGPARRPEGVPYLVLGVDGGFSANVDPRGYSGGPMLVGDAVTGILTRSRVLETRILGTLPVGGALLARPLLGVIEAIRAAGVPLPLPRGLSFRPPTPESARALAATQAILEALDDAGRAALDADAAPAVDALALLVRVDAADRHTFLRAVQQLLVYPVTPGAPLVRFLQELAPRHPPVAAALATILDEPASVAPVAGPGPVPPPLVPPAPRPPGGFVLDVRWAGQDQRRVLVMLRERLPGGLVTRETREVDAEPELIVAACGALLAPSAGGLGEARPIEVWVPPELAEGAFDEAPVDLGMDGVLPVGGLAPVTLRIRWPQPVQTPADVAAARAQELARLVLPQAVAGPFDARDLPTGQPCAVRLAPGADANTWLKHARKEKTLLLVALDQPPALTSPASPARAVLRGGVPVVAWERAPAGKLVSLVTASPPATPLVKGVFDLRAADDTARISVIVAPPDDPIPDDPLLSPL